MDEQRNVSSKRNIMVFIAIAAVGILLFQNISLRKQIDSLNVSMQQIISQQHIMQNTIINELYAQSHRLEESGRASYGESASVVGLSGEKRLVDVEVLFSLKEVDASSDMRVTAKDESGKTVSAAAKYSDSVYRAVLSLDAAKAYSFIYGSASATGELMSYYQPKDELLNRFKVHIARSESGDTFELYPYAANVYDGNDALKIKSVKLVVTEQSPGSSVSEIDLMPYLTEDEKVQSIETGWDQHAQLAYASGDTSYPLQSYPRQIENAISFGFALPEECDFTFELIIGDNLGYTYRYFETLNRRKNNAPHPAASASSSGGSSGQLTIS